MSNNLRSLNHLVVKSVPNPNGLLWEEEVQIKDSLDIVPLAIKLFRDESVEIAGLFAINHHGRVTGYAELGRGTIHTTTLSSRDVVKTALLANAHAVMLCHNHPEEYGPVKVSYEDIATTFAINEALSIMKMVLVDHLVVGQTHVERIMTSPNTYTMEQVSTFRRRVGLNNPKPSLPGGLDWGEMQKFLKDVIGSDF
jgi:hypothetical protein